MTRGATYHENDIVSLVLGEELGCVVHLELHGEYMDEGGLRSRNLRASAIDARLRTENRKEGREQRQREGWTGKKGGPQRV